VGTNWARINEILNNRKAQENIFRLYAMKEIENKNANIKKKLPVSFASIIKLLSWATTDQELNIQETSHAIC